MMKRASVLLIGMWVLAVLILAGRGSYDRAQGSMVVPADSGQARMTEINQAGMTEVNPTKAANQISVVKISQSGTPYCDTGTCTVDLNSDVILQVYPYDDEGTGNLIVGVPVTYKFVITNPGWGTFVNPCALPNTNCTYSATSVQFDNTLGVGKITVHSGNNVIPLPPSTTPGQVTATVTYGGSAASTTFNISTACTQTPKLVEGTARLAVDSDPTTVVASTADLLYTYIPGCKDDYTLWPGTAKLDPTQITDQIAWVHAAVKNLTAPSMGAAVKSGQTVQYTLTVRNATGTTARVTFILPTVPGVGDFVYASGNAMSVAGRILRWNNVPAGDQTIVFTATAP